MSQFNYTIPELLRTIGIRGYLPQAATALNRALRAENEIEYQQQLREASRQITGFEGIEVYEPEGFLFSSNEKPYFEGLPVWMPLLFANEDIGEDLLLDSAIVQVNLPKNIVTTSIQGRNGTVKEYVGNGDYQLSVSGILADRQGYPKDLVALMRAYMETANPLAVTSELLNLLGIYQVVVTGWNLPAHPFINCAAYSFTAISDRPVELQITTDA